MVVGAEGPEPEGSEAPEVAPPAALPVRRRPPDPVARALVTTILIIVVLAVATAAYVVVGGVMGTGAPRTMAEYKLTAAAAKIEGGSKERSDWVDYISALISQGRYRDAQDWIAKGKKTLDKQEISQDMVYMQANLYAAQGNLDQALQAADAALKTMKATRKAALIEMAKTGSPTEASSPLGENYWDLLLLKADIFEQKKDWRSAAAAYDEYLAGNKTAATVFVQRGNVRERLGNTKGAAGDFRRALTFIPDNADALAGLKRIGAAK